VRCSSRAQDFGANNHTLPNHGHYLPIISVPLQSWAVTFRNRCCSHHFKKNLACGLQCNYSAQKDVDLAVILASLLVNLRRVPLDLRLAYTVHISTRFRSCLPSLFLHLGQRRAKIPIIGIRRYHGRISYSFAGDFAHLGGARKLAIIAPGPKAKFRQQFIRRNSSDERFCWLQKARCAET
jgi:hypothetical protein